MVQHASQDFPIDAGGRPAAVLYGTTVNGITDTFQAVDVTSSGEIEVTLMGSSIIQLPPITLSPGSSIAVTQSTSPWIASLTGSSITQLPIAQSPSILINGHQFTSATWSTPVALTNTSVPVVTVHLQSDKRNAGTMFVGGANVDASLYHGYELWPGDTQDISISNLNAVYIDGLSEQRILYVAEKA